MGKGTLVARVRESLPSLGLTVSATTRTPREGEIDGVSYHFMSHNEFMRRVEAGEFVEWAHVHGNCYGTLRSEVDRNLKAGSEAVLVFIMPPSLDVLRERLSKRGTETPQSLELRLANAERELAFADRYDEVVINDDLDRACAELLTIIENHERN